MENKAIAFLWAQLMTRSWRNVSARKDGTVVVLLTSVPLVATPQFFPTVWRKVLGREISFLVLWSIFAPRSHGHIPLGEIGIREKKALPPHTTCFETTILDAVTGIERFHWFFAKKICKNYYWPIDRPLIRSANEEEMHLSHLARTCLYKRTALLELLQKDTVFTAFSGDRLWHLALNLITAHWSWSITLFDLAKVSLLSVRKTKCSAILHSP